MHPGGRRGKRETKMATTREYHDYVMDQLSRAGEFRSIRMMGEYCIYLREKVAALLCDNQLLLKPTPSVLARLPDAERVYPYEGSKTLMVVLEELETPETLADLFEAMYGELPDPKPKKPRKKRSAGGAPPSDPENRKLQHKQEVSEHDTGKAEKVRRKEEESL